MDLAKIFLTSVLLTFLSETSGINEDIVFVLQELFMSDVILITRDEENPDEFLKKVFKLQNFKAFIGTINLNENFVQNFKKEMMAPYQNIMIVSDFSAKMLKKFKNFYSSSIMSSVVWLNFIHEETAVDIRNIYIPYNSKFFLIRKKNKSHYEITDVYQISENSNKIYSDFGYFKNGKLNFKNQSFYYRRRNLQGHQFNVSLSHLSDYTEKFGYFWKLFSEGMNFSIYSNYSKVGNIEPDGSLSGLFKMVNDHMIDGTPSLYVVTNERLDFFDSIFPTAISETLLYVNVQTDLNWTSYIAPFSSKVWISIAAWIGVSTIVLQIIIRSKKISKRITLMDSLFDIMRALSYQAGNSNISSPAFCISYLMPYVLAIILVQYYSGQLLSDLAVKKEIVPFQNLKEAIEDGRYKVLAMKDTYVQFYLRTNEGFEATALRNRKFLEPWEKMPASMSAAFKKLCEGKYVFMTNTAVDFMAKEHCDVTELKTIVFYDSLGILVWKGFPFKNDLTKLMRQIQFSGLVKLKQNNIIIHRDDTVDFQPVSLEQIFPIFLLHFFIIVICGLILLCEIFRKNMRDRPIKSITKFLKMKMG